MTVQILNGVIDELTGIHPSERDSYLQPESLLNWYDFLMGRIDTLWEHKMDAVYQARHKKEDENKPPGAKKPKNRITGKQWTTKVLKLIWDQLFSVWKDRCVRQHSSDIRRRDDYLHQEAVASTKAMYAQEDKIRVLDRAFIFRQPIEELIEKSTNQLQAWVSNIKPALAWALKDAKTFDVKSTRDIREYLTRRPP
jgi:hypothetical protein